MDINDDTIWDLWKNASSAGDSITQALCILALDEADTEHCLEILGEFGPPNDVDIAEWARAECVKVIEEGQANDD